VSRRARIAFVIVVAWLAGMAVLARRELFHGESERLAIASLLVNPGSQYYSLTRGADRVGYASSTLDTSLSGIRITELLVADVASPTGARRLAARSVANLTRRMGLVDFGYELGEGYGPYRAIGRLGEDSVLTLIVMAGRSHVDTTRTKLPGPLMLPSTLPLALMLGHRASVGQRATYAAYDPVSGRVGDVTVRVAAESVFVVTDSAAFDAAARRWGPALQDTVRAWRLEQEGGGPFSQWVDEQGRIVAAEPLGVFGLARTAYEMASPNWSLDLKDRGAPIAPPAPKSRDTH
jgi:hypothetical protein